VAAAHDNNGDEDEPLSDDLEEARKLLFPGLSEAEGRALLRATLKRAEEQRRLDDVLFERLRGPAGDDDPAVTWARAVFADMGDHTSEELGQVVDWLEADEVRVDAVFESRLEAFRAGLRAGERL
jgi:hypothetical protein